MNEIVKRKIGSGIVSNRMRFILDKIDLSSIQTILDIGSWHLEQSIEFKGLFPDAHVYAFEPVPESYDNCLFKSKFHQNIYVFNVALTNFIGETSFYPVDSNLSSTPNVGASSLLKFKDGLNGSFFGQNWIQKEIKVKTDTLDNWSNLHNIHHIDIIWIDVQGAELQVFQGGENILNNTKIIFSEVGLKPYYEGHSLKKDIDNFLLTRNFVEIKESFELNGFDYEANTIYVNKNWL
jgi:FkbM family methyltransferase